MRRLLSQPCRVLLRYSVHPHFATYEVYSHSAIHSACKVPSLLRTPSFSHATYRTAHIEATPARGAHYNCSCNHRLHSWSHVAGTGPWSRIPLPQCQCATLVRCPPPCRSRPPETSTRAGCADGLVLYTIGTLLLQPSIARPPVQPSSCTLSRLSPTSPRRSIAALRCAALITAVLLADHAPASTLIAHVRYLQYPQTRQDQTMTNSLESSRPMLSSVSHCGSTACFTPPLSPGRCLPRVE